MSRGNLYSFEKVFVWRVDDNGIAMGQLNPDSLGSPPLTSHARELFGPITGTLPNASQVAATFRGGGRAEGRAAMGLNEIGEGTLNLSQLDADAMAFLRGSSVDTTSMTNVEIFARDNTRPSSVQVGMMLILRYQQRSGAQAGQNRYATIVYPLVEATLSIGNVTQEAGQNPTPATLTFQPSLSTRFPTGVAFSSNQGWYNNEEFEYILVSEYGFALTAFVGDGTATTYTLGYRPVYNTVTSGLTNQWFARDGVLLAPSSVNTSTGVVTLAAAGASGQRHVALYQTAYITP